MGPNLRSNVCDECPFRANGLKSFLGPYDSPRELHYLVRQVHFPCHKIQGERDVTWEEAKDIPLCRGALIYLRKSAGRHDIPEIEALRKQISPEEFDQVKSVPEFLSPDNS